MNTMPTYRESARAYENLVSHAADQWWRDSCRLAEQGQYPPFYLYFRKGSLLLFTDDEHAMALGQGYELADSQPYRPSMDRDAVRARIHEHAKRLPILP